MENLYFLKKTLNALPSSNNLKGRNYLFVTVRSFSFVMHQELFLANILAKNGGNVYIFLDDGQLPHWDTYQLHDACMPANASKTPRNKISKCLYKVLYGHKNITFINSSSLMKGISMAEVKEKYKLDENDVKNAISSVRRFFECGYYDPQNKEHQAYYAKTEDNILLMKHFVSTLHGKYNFNAVITSHGIYSIWGTAYNFFKGIKVPIYIYGAHAYKNYHTHFTDTLAQTLSLDSSCIDYMKNGVLTDGNKKLVDEYFLARRNHTTKDTNIYYSWMKDNKEMKIEKGDKALNYAMFPNIIWDGDVAQRDTIFDGMLDWMKKTINYFIEHPKNNLIIRFHPAEATLWKDTINLSTIIAKLYPKLESYPNITVIKSDQQVDTYQFVQNNVDVGLIYEGILSLELTHMHKPVISPSCNRYTGGTFVIKPETADEYYAMLDEFKFDGYFTEKKTEEFYKYAYWYLYLSAFVMPNYSEQTFGKIVYNEKSVEKLKDPGFVKLFEKIVSL